MEVPKDAYDTDLSYQSLCEKSSELAANDFAEALLCTAELNNNNRRRL